MDIDENIKVSPFRLKDLLPVINLQTKIRIFYKGPEIDYEKASDYRDMYVVDITTRIRNGNPVIYIMTADEIEYACFPKSLL